MLLLLCTTLLVANMILLLGLGPAFVTVGWKCRGDARDRVEGMFGSEKLPLLIPVACVLTFPLTDLFAACR